MDMSALADFSGPIEKRSLNGAAADSLRQAIVTGIVAPGARLTEVALARQMDLSRGTVRAALHRFGNRGARGAAPLCRLGGGEPDFARCLGTLHTARRA